MVTALEMELYCAAMCGDVDAVDRILSSQQTPPNNNNHTLLLSQAFAGHTILHGACNANHSGVVADLLQRVPAVRQYLLPHPDVRHGRTPLQTALAVGHDDLAHWLLDTYDNDDALNLRHVDFDGRHALHLACLQNTAAVIPALIQRLAPKKDSSHNPTAAAAILHAPDRHGKTPLLYACDHANVAVVELLLETFVPTPTTTCWYLEIAKCIRGVRHVPRYQAVVQLVLDAGVPVKAAAKTTPGVPYQIHADFAAWLAQRQADPAQQIRTAAAAGNVILLLQLLKKQSPSLSLSSSKDMPRLNHELVALASPGSRTGWTALHGAARYGHVAACSLLLYAGALPLCNGHQNEVEEDDDDDIPTPLQLAVQNGHLDVVEELLRHVLVGR